MESLINKVREMLAESRRRRVQQQETALMNDFRRIGFFTIEEAQTFQRRFPRARVD